MGPSNTTGRFATDLKIFRISQTNNIIGSILLEMFDRRI